MNLTRQCVGSLILKRASSTFSPEVLLSKENKKRCMQKFSAITLGRVDKHTSEATRQAAVLIPICIVKGKVSLLYTLRAADLKNHRGQVSFPGGMFDDSDESLEKTALRETHEELGIHAKDIEIWGRGNFVTRRDLNILPIIGCLKSTLTPESLKVNFNEVEAVFALSIEHLCNPKFNRHTQFRGLYSTPAYLGGAYRVWGLTAVITYIFLKSFLPSEVYPQKLPYIPDVLSTISKS